MTTTHATSNSAETEQLAAQFAATLKPGTVIALQGELGAGKTCFVRGLARGLGINPASVSSPTFVIEHRYAAPNGKPTLVHIDAYRLTSAADLETIGWDELIASRSAVIAVEWADRIAAALPPDSLHIRLEHSGNGRQIHLP